MRYTLKILVDIGVNPNMMPKAENSSGFWWKCEYDSEGNRIYYEDSSGVIRDNRPKDDIITLNGVKYKRIEQ
jgi:hypothetical protein